MSEKVVIDGKTYNKLEVIQIEIDGEEKDKLTEKDMERKDSINVNIVVKAN